MRISINSADQKHASYDLNHFLSWRVSLHIYASWKVRNVSMSIARYIVFLKETLKETEENPFSAIWAAKRTSKAAFFAEFHALHSWNNEWIVRFQKWTKTAPSKFARAGRAKHQKNLYTLHYPLNKKRVKVQVKVQVCRRERHAAILNFNHAFTSLRWRNPQNLKLIRADFASLWKKCVSYCFSQRQRVETWKFDASANPFWGGGISGSSHMRK